MFSKRRDGREILLWQRAIAVGQDQKIERFQAGENAKPSRSRAASEYQPLDRGMAQKRKVPQRRELNVARFQGRAGERGVIRGRNVPGVEMGKRHSLQGREIANACIAE